MLKVDILDEAGSDRLVSSQTTRKITACLELSASIVSIMRYTLLHPSHAPSPLRLSTAANKFDCMNGNNREDKNANL
jgi:hypothetical protein